MHVFLPSQARITSDTQDLAKTHVDSKKKREKVSHLWFQDFHRFVKRYIVLERIKLL